MPRYQVIVVGAGPTGLTLAAELKRLDIAALIFDKLQSGANTSRAAVVHAKTLEMLEPLGVSDELIESGLQIQQFRLRNPSGPISTISFKDLKTKYPFGLLCPQSRTEAILLRRLESLGGDVERPWELVRAEAGEAGVQVEFRNDGESRNVTAPFLVGCDGMHSVVRQAAGISFEGGAYEESFVLADVEMEWGIPRDEVSLFLSEKGILLVAPLPGNLFRIVATVEQAPEQPQIEDFAQILRERGPRDEEANIRNMAWSSRFHVHHRVASTMRRGCFLLAGDAAHVHSPAGGQGMNTGIQDAVTLAAALERAIRDGNEGALDVWSQERLVIAHSVVGMTDMMTKMGTTSSPTLKVARDLAMRFIGHVPFVQQVIARKLSELDRK